jgi:hypothetical protein
MANVKKAWVEVDTREKLDKEFSKNKELSAAYPKWRECFYQPWFNAWKAGKATLNFEQARREGTEPIETCSSFATCGPRPDWRSAKDKAAEAAVLNARKK